MGTSSNYVIVCHNVPDQAKVYEDFLHHDQAVTKLTFNYCICHNQNNA